MWLERDRGMDLDPKVLDAILLKLRSYPNSADFINLPPACMPIFLD
jgi:hypothetical protein